MFPQIIHLVIIVFSTLSYNLVLTQPCRRSGKNCIQRTGSPVNNGDGGLKVADNLGASQPPAEEEKPRKRCCPYDFDSSRCKVIDERILCGYNRNGGWPLSGDLVKQLSDGCRLRNGRLECGYVEEPYHNLRRPPAWDNEPANNELPAENGDDGVIVQSQDSKEKLKKNNMNKGYQTTRPQPNCVEVDGRIVCKPRRI